MYRLKVRHKIEHKHNHGKSHNHNVKSKHSSINSIRHKHHNMHLVEHQSIKEHKAANKTNYAVITYRLLAVLIIILLIGYVIFFSNIIKKDCGNDMNCFNQLSKKCSGARAEVLKDVNVYEYVVKGNIGSDCAVDVKLKRMAAGMPVDLKGKLEGKSMTCRIPRELLKETDLDSMSDLMNYCSGQLKEGLYEIIIDNMYGLVVKNMANITKTVQGDLLKLSSQAL